MTGVILLDAGPLGLISNPHLSPGSMACSLWLERQLRANTRVIVPEIADYEVRRELIRGKKLRGLRQLDQLGGMLDYLPLTTAAMRKAAEFWAQARQQGRPTAANQALDADVILAGQAAMLIPPNVIVATTNPGHISRFVSAARWQDINP